ncbi:MAG TPA: helix-turn-helix domain-containing protein [Pyrinomonadaceae bacterium]|jgi:DNA-binding NtrC family response regulator|nr:helix-turn-helix domain-containing protein [Pyrinomonadaceae bacterium]
MGNSNLMEREKLRLLKSAETKGSYTEAAGATSSSSRLEALRVLALALFNEIEALGQIQHGPMRTINLADEVHRFETDLIRGALMQTGGRQRRAARLLGVKVPTLHAKMKRYKIDAEEFQNDSPDLRLRAR